MAHLEVSAVHAKAPPCLTASHPKGSTHPTTMAKNLNARASNHSAMAAKNVRASAHSADSEAGKSPKSRTHPIHWQTHAALSTWLPHTSLPLVQPYRRRVRRMFPVQQEPRT